MKPFSNAFKNTPPEENEQLTANEGYTTAGNLTNKTPVKPTNKNTGKIYQ